MKVGIVGYGWVGQAMHKLFPDASVYDKYTRRYPHLPKCDLTFICVPTPWTETGLDCSAVDNAISKCKGDLVVIRSTCSPGFGDLMQEKYPDKRIVVQPEYLGETPGHPMLDMKTRPFMIIGGDPKDRRDVINCYHHVYNANITIRQVSRLEAEVIKLTENRAIFYKVMQCQELYDACEAAGIDYYTVRDAVYGDDPRMNLWWTFVYPDYRGANSKCIPKDVYGWSAWCESVGVNPEATAALLKYNEGLLTKHAPTQT